MPNTDKIILASGSPRRKDMLEAIGLDFDIMPADIDETPFKKEKPRDYVIRLAIEKAKVVAQKYPDAIVIGSDCTVALGRRIYGKPEDETEGREMLKTFSGRKHHVMTSVCVYYKSKAYTAMTDSKVKFKPLGKKDLDMFFRNPDNWQGAAGSYKIQSLAGGALVKEVQGSVTGIIGMPLAETINLLRTVGVDI